MQNAIFSERDDLYKMILPLPETTVGGDTKFDDVEFAFGDFKKPIMRLLFFQRDYNHFVPSIVAVLYQLQFLLYQ